MTDASPAPARLSRRGLLGATAAGIGGLAVGAGGATLAGTVGRDKVADPADVPRRSFSPHEAHQAGIVTPMTPVTELVALDLLPTTDRAALGRLLKLWSADVASLMAGRAIPGDMTPELAQENVRLTVTIGLGPGVFRLPGLEGRAPTGFVDIPPMVHDRLEERWSGGDLLLVVAADDATSVDYAVQALVRDAATFAWPRWVQRGGWRPTDGNGVRVTGRNLFGQVDGTANPKGDLRDEVVWADGPGWFAGGTQLVVRRIEMDLPEWDKLTRHEQERALGRDLASGAPLTGGTEDGQPDLAARDSSGALVIPADAHVRLSHPSNLGGAQILRRATNYSHAEMVDGSLRRTHGLVFVAYCVDLERQFVPMQRALDAGDALNRWTTAIGSAVFAIPPGFAADSWLARDLFA